MFAKVLVANRGEIAVRAFRAAYELGVKTVAVFPYEDRNAIHRIKADEAYVIGERGHPVRAYLDITEIIRAAKESDADAIYPGYGFLSENPGLARACAEAGIIFIGPPPEFSSSPATRCARIEAAQGRRRPNPAGRRRHRQTWTSSWRERKQIGFPVFVKAVAGGGGRGMRRVEDPDDSSGNPLPRPCVRPRVRSAIQPSFIEQAVGRPRHIEVQILADTQGNTIHLFERDCSVQRRHQKVVEIAPAPHISSRVARGAVP